MARPRDTWLGALIRRRSVAHWRAAALALQNMAPDHRNAAVRAAQDLRPLLDQLLAHPGADPGEPPYDWIWRPEALRAEIHPQGAVAAAPGTALGGGLKLFHDGTGGDASLFQGTRAEGGFDLTLETFRFEGSFVSLVMDMPPQGRTRLTRTHVISLAARLKTDAAPTMYARLNVETGPNVDTLVREAAPDPEGHIHVAFDLAHMSLDAAPITAVWVDLIVETPGTQRIVFDDLALLRRPAPAF